MLPDPAHVLLRKAQDDERLATLVAGNASVSAEQMAALDDSVALTPFAAEMRYDYLPPEEGAQEPFDRARVLFFLRTALSWAEAIIGE